MRAMRCGGVVAVVLAMLGGSAAAADAATVTGRSEIVFELDFGRGMDFVDYEAAPGETNQATVTLSADATTATVTDPSAVLTAAGECTRVDDHTVSCPTDSKLVIPEVDLGDGDDRLTVIAPGIAPYRTTADGGPGNDTLATGPAADILTGGEGADTLQGDAGDDRVLQGATGARDAIDGGPGRDLVTYEGRSAPVVVELSGGFGDDTVLGVEEVVGGDGGDRISGDAAHNQLRGGAGDDVLNGFGGGDVLAGEDGRDAVVCRGGRDVEVAPDLHRAVDRTCETVRISIDADDNAVPEYTYEEPAHPSALLPEALLLSFACPLRFGYDFVHRQPISMPASCSGRITLLRVAGRPRVLGKATFKRDDDKTVPVTVKVKRRARELLRRRKGTDIIVATSGETLPAVRWRTRTPR